MSERQRERLVLAASALVALGRDDRLRLDGYAKRAIDLADVMIAQLDETTPEEDSDALEDACEHAHEEGYEKGVADTERRWAAAEAAAKAQPATPQKTK